MTFASLCVLCACVVMHYVVCCGEETGVGEGRRVRTPPGRDENDRGSYRKKAVFRRQLG